MVLDCTERLCSMSVAREKNWYFGHANLRGSWIQHQTNQKDGFLIRPPPLSPSYGVSDYHEGLIPPPPTTSSSSGTRISPAVLIIIVILAILFFISGVLHLLVRFLTKHASASTSSPSTYPEISGSGALQRQLQQLFHLHDSGLDQAFIDALPVFMYKDIVGLKEPFDCAVCLCEFSEKDKLRLLPMCSHAFHIDCIDTWLLSNSTCPLCRGTIFGPGFSIENPIFDYDDPREEDCFPSNGENGLPNCQKTVEIEEVVVEKGVFSVRLGKFKKTNGRGNLENAVGETSRSNLDARRCYSMGSYQYVVGDVNLMVALNSERNKHCVGGTEENCRSLADAKEQGKKIGIGTKTDSYSVSKIWLWPKKGQFASSSENQSNNYSLNIDMPWMGRNNI